MTDPIASTVSRLPNPVTRVPGLAAIGRELTAAVSGSTVPPATVSLAHLRIGQMVDSDYLIRMHTETLRRAGESEKRIDAVETWRASDAFSAQESAALAIAEALLTDNPDHERVTDELYAAAADVFTDTELTVLLIALGQILFYLPLALVGKPLPGVGPAHQWRP